MIIKKGTKLRVGHKIKGTFIGVAQEDFDTDARFYPIAVSKDPVEGLAGNWLVGEDIPCRSSLCTIEIIED